MSGPLSQFHDPDAVQIGRARLHRSLHRSLLLPGETQTLDAILSALDAADQAMTAPIPDDQLYATATGTLLALLDATRGALAAFGRR